MADEWFVQRDGQTYGPFSSAQLKQMTTTGRVLPVDLVTKGEGARWVPASQIKGLFATSPAAASQLPPMPPPLPATAPSSNTTSHLVSPFSDLGSSPRSALWAKILGGVGLTVVFIGLLCPWYKVSSHTSVDTTGVNAPGMNFPNPGYGQGGRGGYGIGGPSFPNSGSNNLGRKQESSTSESAMGLMSVPGLFVLLLTIGIGAMFFLPKRLYVLIATGLACLLLLTIFGSFLYVPSVEGSFEFGETGFGASGSVKAGASWGQFVSLIGDLMLLVTGVLILLRVGSTHSTGGSGKIAGELSVA